MIKELKTFLAVVRFGTFAAAGARTGLTQSAVSAQIQRLEEELGAPLFDRTGRSARLNPAGEEAVAMAQQVPAWRPKVEGVHGRLVKWVSWMPCPWMCRRCSCWRPTSERVGGAMVMTNISRGKRYIFVLRSTNFDR